MQTTSNRDELVTTDLWADVGGGHELRIRRIEPIGPRRASILFLPGLFSDARFFLNSRGEGPARFFVERGFCALLADLRGHGASRAPAGPKAWSFDEHAERDLPALVDAAHRAAGAPLFIMAHSMGGYVALAGLGLRPELQRKLAGVVVLAAAVNDYSDGSLKKRLAIPTAAVLSLLAREFPARRLRLGSANEPRLLMQQFASWAKRDAFDSRDHATDYFQALASVELPVLAGIGAADRFHASPRSARKLFDKLASADKTFTIFGRASGSSRDFGHVDVVRGAAAETDVLPQLQRWLLAHA